MCNSLCLMYFLGVMGLSTAFWLKSHHAGKDMRVVVVERDSKVLNSSNAYMIMIDFTRLLSNLALVYESVFSLVHGWNPPTIFP